jgi:hypothetical protein
MEPDVSMLTILISMELRVDRFAFTCSSNICTCREVRSDAKSHEHGENLRTTVAAAPRMAHSIFRAHAMKRVPEKAEYAIGLEPSIYRRF